MIDPTGLELTAAGLTAGFFVGTGITVIGHHVYKLATDENYRESNEGLGAELKEEAGKTVEKIKFGLAILNAIADIRSGKLAAAESEEVTPEDVTKSAEGTNPTDTAPGSDAIPDGDKDKIAQHGAEGELGNKELAEEELERVLNDPDTVVGQGKNRDGSKKTGYLSPDGTLVLHNPSADDSGSMFIPKKEDYFDRHFPEEPDDKSEDSDDDPDDK